jgi:hypothetical protein
MKISKEVIEAFRMKKEQQDKEMRERSIHREKIKKELERGEITTLIPLWHEKIEDIDISNPRTSSLNREVLSEGLANIPNVSIELLLDKMISGNPELYRRKELLNEGWGDGNIYEVIYHWKNGKKLTPPSIKYLEEVQKLFVADGKHRLNVAYYFGATHIPIVMGKKEYHLIKQVLGI